jgi:predicted outer membrane repeat protein
MRVGRRLSAAFTSLLLVAGLLGAAAPAALGSSPVTYVNHLASGNNDGSSWEHAFTDLQVALELAEDGDELWVAAGTYKPTTGTDRDATFALMDGVAVYGGFTGDETLRSQRNWTTNVTTLSGDIGTVADASDNSHNVVTGATGATLDGFTVTGGASSGIYNATASPTLENLVISGNSAGAYSGGGIANYGSSPTLTNVTISGNSAAYYGGGLFNRDSSPTLTNVTISGNSAAHGGGGIYNQDSSLILTNVTISGNSAGGTGGGIHNVFSSPQIRNSILWGNSAPTAPESYNFNSTPTVTYSIVAGASVYTGPGNSNANPLFVTAVPAAPSTGGNLRLGAGSPAINAGDPADTTATLGVTTDLAGNDRIFGGRVDMGAYEVQQTNPPAQNLGYWRTADLTDLLPLGLGGYSVATRADADAVFKATNCGKKNYDAVGCLAGQLLVAELNVANDAVHACIDATIASADLFLVSVGYTGPGKYSLSKADRKTALGLKNALEGYNKNGCP